MTGPQESSTLYWRAGTRYHDWVADGGAIPRGMIAAAREAGVLGDIEWVSSEPTDRQVPVDSFADLDALLRKPVPEGRSFRVAAGGSAPAPWSVALLLMPFDEESGAVEGYNLLTMEFGGAAWQGGRASDALVRLFRTLHTAEQTEFAFIHPHPRWAEISSPAGGEYGTPVTFAPFFSGVFSATFLGPKHLELFDDAKLAALDAYEIERTEAGLFLRITRDVAEAKSAEAEREMFRLTEIFRKAQL